MRSLRLSLLAALCALLIAAPASAQTSSPGIAALQVALKSKHLYKGKVDGLTGPLTRRGIVLLQRRHGMRPSGKLEPRIRRALGWRGRPVVGSRVMRRGQRGWDVAALQFLLQRGGFGAGRADGVFGPLTRQAVLRAQRAAGMKPDGLVGPKTLAFLRRGGTGPGGSGESGSTGTTLIADEGEGTTSFQRPVVGPVGDRFGATRDGGRRRHAGLDFPVPQGTTVTAAAAGTTIFAGYNSGGYGNLVVVQHANGYTTWYAHLSRITSWVGERISAGTRVGLVGSTGNSTGPHLHFEIRHYDTPLNPLPLITPGATMARAASASLYSAAASATGGAAAPSGAGTPVPSRASGHRHGHECEAPRPDRTGKRGGGANWIATESLCLP